MHTKTVLHFFPSFIALPCTDIKKLLIFLVGDIFLLVVLWLILKNKERVFWKGIND